MPAPQHRDTPPNTLFPFFDVPVGAASSPSRMPTGLPIHNHRNTTCHSFWANHARMSQAKVKDDEKASAVPRAFELRRFRYQESKNLFSTSQLAGEPPEVRQSRAIYRDPQRVQLFHLSQRLATPWF